MKSEDGDAVATSAKSVGNRPATWDALVPENAAISAPRVFGALEDSGSVGPHSGWQPEHLLHVEGDRLIAALPSYSQVAFLRRVRVRSRLGRCLRTRRHRLLPQAFDRRTVQPGQRATLAGGQGRRWFRIAQEPAGLPGIEQLSSAYINFTDPFTDAALAEQPGWLQRIGCQYHWQNRGYRDFVDFLDALSSRKRKQMRKEREQVAGQGIEFEWLEGRQLTEAQWDFVYACYANTYAVRRQRPYLTREFFSQLAERMPQAIRVVLAKQGSRPVAMAFSLVGGDSFYGRYWGCLAEFDRLHFETCFYQGMDYAIANGFARFDAGAQGEHKLIRGFEPVITHSWHYLRSSRPESGREGLSGAGADRCVGVRG